MALNHIFLTGLYQILLLFYTLLDLIEGTTLTLLKKNTHHFVP